MGTVFQHLPKISYETIYSNTLFKKSNKIITMQASIFCCVLFFIGFVNSSSIWMAKRSDDASAERMDVADRWDLGAKRMDVADRWDLGMKRTDVADRWDLGVKRMDVADRWDLGMKRMDVADRWDLGQRMDSEIGELMPTMDEEAKFKRVLNGLTGKLVPSVLGAFFKSDEHGHIKVHPLNVASAKALEALKDKIAEKIKRKIGEPTENNGDGEAKISAAKNSDDVNPLPELRFFGWKR